VRSQHGGGARLRDLCAACLRFLLPRQTPHIGVYNDTAIGTTRR